MADDKQVLSLHPKQVKKENVWIQRITVFHYLKV